MRFSVSTIPIQVSIVDGGIRLQTEFENVFLENQTLSAAEPILRKNFDMVRNVLVHRVGSEILRHDLDAIVLKVVLQHFCLYNKWKNFYPKERNRDLTFLIGDLEKPMTYDAVIDYVKSKNKKHYRETVAAILGIDANSLEIYERGLKEFTDRR